MMAIVVNWVNDTHKTIYIRYERFWTWADFAKAKVEIDTLLNSTSHTVNIISDSRESGGLPQGNLLSHLVQSFQTAPSNIGQIVVVGANPMFKMALQILQTVSLNRAAQNIRFSKTLDDANNLINS
jgi:hypothetical protein